MKQKLKIIIFLCVFLFGIVNAYSQSYRLKSFKLKGDISKAFNNDNIKQELHKQFNIPSDYEFRPNDPNNNKTFKDVKDELGFTHERLVQFYKGIKVENSDIRVHYKNDAMVSVNGEYANETNIDIVPILNKDIAIKKALEFVNAKKYIWEIPSENTWLQIFKNDNTTTSYPNPELVICKNHFNQGDSTLHIAYKMDVFSVDPFGKSCIYVDAKDGIILNSKSILYSDEGVANTFHNGSQTITTFRVTSTNYILRDDGRKIKTKNANGYSFFDQANEFSDTDNSWKDLNTDIIANDAHWDAMMTYDYFLEKHGRKGYDDLDGVTTNYVHFGTKYGLPISNAYWDKGVNGILFGDGDGPFAAWISLDLVAHEFGHGICIKTANLDYDGQSGAINEGLSDIWGACVENFCNHKYVGLDKNIWEAGDEIVCGNTNCHRSLQNPKLYNHPNCKGGKFWINTDGCVPDETTDYCGVHKNSGVMNYWFYLLVNGGNSVNDLYNAYNTLPIDIDKAAQIVYRAEKIYMTQSSDFNDARRCTIDAAIDLFGDNSLEVVSVTNSWYAVGVGQSFICNDIYLTYENPYIIDTYFYGCNFELEGIYVRNGAKLTLDVVNEVLIKGPFEVDLHSQFEIK